MLEEFSHLADLSDTGRVESVDLGTSDLQVDISDALSEKESVKFTIHTVTSLLPRFARPEFSTVRTHEEFVWLAERLNENVEYAGLILPAAPAAPDFAASREKLAKLSDSESSLAKEEYESVKCELEAEYLATFKKTVAIHEAFLRRIAEHKILREDEIFKVFLEFEGELNVRGKNRRELVQGFFRSGWKSVDDALLSAHKDKDEFFESQRRFIMAYDAQLRAAASDADKMNAQQKAAADAYIRVSSALQEFCKIERNKETADFLYHCGEFFDKYRKLEGRMSADSDLKLSDTLHCYSGDCSSARDLLYRRCRALADYDSANKELERARSKNKETEKAEAAQEAAYEKFNGITELAKLELPEFKARWVACLSRSLRELAELQIKHARAQVELLKQTIEKLKQT